MLDLETVAVTLYCCNKMGRSGRVGEELGERKGSCRGESLSYKTISWQVIIIIIIINTEKRKPTMIQISKKYCKY